MKQFKNPYWKELCDRLSDLKSMEESAYDILRNIQSLQSQMEDYYDKVVDGEYDKPVEILREKMNDYSDNTFSDSMMLEDAFVEMDKLKKDVKNGCYF